MTHLRSFPTRLPRGERVLWQGRPSWRALAVRAFHLRKLAIYFAILLAWYAVTEFSSHLPWMQAAQSTAIMAGVALTPLVLICLYAWMTTRATTYTITSKRVILRGGIALPITFNLPFSKIEAAGLKVWPDQHGDIPLTLAAGEKLAYLVLWPHARPWRMAQPEPMLRCIAQASLVARILARAMAGAAEMPVPVSPDPASRDITGSAASPRPHAPVPA